MHLIKKDASVISDTDDGCKRKEGKLNGKDLRTLPLIERKRMLNRLIRRKRARMFYLDQVEGAGRLLFEEVTTGHNTAQQGAIAAMFFVGQKDYFLGKQPLPQLLRVLYRITKEADRGRRISAVVRLQLGDAATEKATHYFKTNGVSPSGRHGQACTPGQCRVAPEAGR